LKRKPIILDRKFSLQFVDNALADVAERSDKVGKDFEVKRHHRLLFCIHC
jgi:hypothetical protein